MIRNEVDKISTTCSEFQPDTIQLSKHSFTNIWSVTICRYDCHSLGRLHYQRSPWMSMPTSLTLLLEGRIQMLTTVLVITAAQLNSHLHAANCRPHNMLSIWHLCSSLCHMGLTELLSTLLYTTNFAMISMRTQLSALIRPSSVNIPIYRYVRLRRPGQAALSSGLVWLLLVGSAYVWNIVRRKRGSPMLSISSIVSFDGCRLFHH